MKTIKGTLCVALGSGSATILWSSFGKKPCSVDADAVYVPPAPYSPHHHTDPHSSMALFKPDASKSLFIDGAFRAPAWPAPVAPFGRCVNPGEQELLATVPSASQSDIDAAVAAAAAAAPARGARGAGRAPVPRVRRRQAADRRSPSSLGLQQAARCQVDLGHRGRHRVLRILPPSRRALGRRQGTPVALLGGDYTAELRWAPVGVAALIVPLEIIRC